MDAPVSDSLTPGPDRVPENPAGEDVHFYFGIGTLQFIEALQKGYIDLSRDYVHNYPDSGYNNLYLTPVLPGTADLVTSCAAINSMQSHGRELFGFDYDFSRTDYLIQAIHEYNAQPEKPRKIRRSLVEFRKLCRLNGVRQDQILPRLQLIKLTFRGFLLEFKPDILTRLVVRSEEELYQAREFRFRFMSPKIPFSAVASYTGIGILEDTFTRKYFALLDRYQKDQSQIDPEDRKARKLLLHRFYLNQSRLIREIKSNIHKPYMVRYLDERDEEIR